MIKGTEKTKRSFKDIITEGTRGTVADVSVEAAIGDLMQPAPKKRKKDVVAPVAEIPDNSAALVNILVSYSESKLLGPKLTTFSLNRASLERLSHEKLQQKFDSVEMFLDASKATNMITQGVLGAVGAGERYLFEKKLINLYKPNSLRKACMENEDWMMYLERSKLKHGTAWAPQLDPLVNLVLSTGIIAQTVMESNLAHRPSLDRPAPSVPRPVVDKKDEKVRQA